MANVLNNLFGGNKPSAQQDPVKAGDSGKHSPCYVIYHSQCAWLHLSESTVASVVLESSIVRSSSLIVAIHCRPLPALSYSSHAYLESRN